MAGLNGLSRRELVYVILQHGFVFHREEGDHRVYVKAVAIRPVIILTYDELPTFKVKNCLRTANIPTKDFLRLLGRKY